MSKFKDYINKNVNDVKTTFCHFFTSKNTYSKLELTLNWIICFVPILITLLEIPIIIIRWKYLVGAFLGTYPAFLWCPIWAGIIFVILIIVEFVGISMKLQQRRRRRKFHMKSTTPKSLKGTFVGKIMDKKYESMEDKQKHNSRFD
ncbi:MAG: hypothetical protein LBF00_03010 [Mycoplasmataceae bacterium]|nr:hypothetical protein [Mycoplasmataceae bacterium]